MSTPLWPKCQKIDSSPSSKAYPALLNPLIVYPNPVENMMFAFTGDGRLLGWHAYCTRFIGDFPERSRILDLRKSKIMAGFESLGKKQKLPRGSCPMTAGDDTRLLLEAFELFTQASGSLESPFTTEFQVRSSKAD